MLNLFLILLCLALIAMVVWAVTRARGISSASQARESEMMEALVAARGKVGKDGKPAKAAKHGDGAPPADGMFAGQLPVDVEDDGPPSRAMELTEMGLGESVLGGKPEVPVFAPSLHFSNQRPRDQARASEKLVAELAAAMKPAAARIEPSSEDAPTVPMDRIPPTELPSPTTTRPRHGRQRRPRRRPRRSPPRPSSD
jgi:hypothetical protein